MKGQLFQLLYIDIEFAAGWHNFYTESLVIADSLGCRCSLPG